MQRFEELIRPNGLFLKHAGQYDYYLRQINYTPGKGGFRQELERLGVYGTNSREKFIPTEYLFDSVDNRLEILKGIIDTDGYCEGSSYDICLNLNNLY